MNSNIIKHTLVKINDCDATSDIRFLQALQDARNDRLVRIAADDGMKLIRIISEVAGYNEELNYSWISTHAEFETI